ncbi:hypothetical protein B0T17DRAFT_29195 [Bombardia bombarda]|uniref:Zn(2)-C6 fungal-type domain-containing protein n=1 Tax=Bombardia bombarda TaxID=252184 RepID=A0AA40CDR8_9PEZI|nr:hypothetical protein B0T17DRAFT_29195 [Bombardia bombarda]
MEFGMPLDLFPPPGLDDEPPFPDFDYAAFLHGNDIDYVAEGSPTSTNNTTLSDDSLQTLTGYLPTIIAPATNSSPRTSTNTGTNTRSGPAAGSIGQSTSLPPKQRVERRGHTKSRRGCFHCKRRRIKCQETRPACGHCIKTGLKCEYPTMPQHVMLQHQLTTGQ